MNDKCDVEIRLSSLKHDELKRYEDKDWCTMLIDVNLDS